MDTPRRATALLTALMLVGGSGLAAQGRRTSDGGGGDSRRSTPSSSGSSSGSRSQGGSSQPSRGGGSSTTSTGTRRSGTASSGSSTTSTGTRRSGTASSGSSTGSQSGRPASGKIGAVKREAQAARNRGTVATGSGVFVGTCWGCNYGGWYGDQWGWYHGGWWYPSNYPPPDYYPPSDYPPPAGAGQGYQPYPYADSDSSSQQLERRSAPQRRMYGAVTVQYFSDAGSTTKAGRLVLEGAVGALRGELEYSHYAEPVLGGTNHLHTLHVGIAGQPRIGSNAYLIAGVAARGVILDDGSNAWGPEGELGIQAFPLRPFGVNVTGRLAGLSWNGNDYFAFRELNTTGSVFINRVELQAGWHWMKIGDSPAFGGPIVGMRVWF